MAETKHVKAPGAMKKGTALWQSSWMTKAMSNGYNAQAKLVFMRIASFGDKGCWMNNETFQEEFNRSDRTIRRAITALWSKGDIIVMGWDGHGRKIYATGHPNVTNIVERKFKEMASKGKITDFQTFLHKIRLRKHEQPESPQEAEHEVKGLAHYRGKASHAKK